MSPSPFPAPRRRRRSDVAPFTAATPVTAPGGGRRIGTIVLVVLAAALALLAVDAGPAGACTPLPWPEWRNITEADRAPAPSHAGNIEAVRLIEHRAANEHGTASVSVAIRYWGPEPPSAPSEARLHDDTDIDVDHPDGCSFPDARSEGALEYVAETDAWGSIVIQGQPDEADLAALARLYGEPSPLQVDDASVSAATADLPAGRGDSSRWPVWVLGGTALVVTIGSFTWRFHA